MGLSIERIEILLLIAAVVAMLARRVRLPYTVGLVATGVVLAFSGIASDIQLTKSLIFTAFLPPLVFEAAFHISWSKLRQDLPVVLTLATNGGRSAVGELDGGGDVVHCRLGMDSSTTVRCADCSNGPGVCDCDI